MKKRRKTSELTSSQTRPAAGRATVRSKLRSTLSAFVLMLVVSSMAVLLPAQPVAANGDTPTVNGLYYGDGDDAKYQLYATSVNGSKLYTYYDAPSKWLYVALVVTHSVNDMVCSSTQAYTGSAGWNPPRDCKRGTDSEFAEFTFECAPGSANSWIWRQAMGCAVGTTDPLSTWKSDSTCGAATGPWPPSIQASTSWVSNANTYQTAYPYATPWPPTPAPPWDMYVDGTALTSWKSPFVASAPNDVTQVPGYPTYTTYDQLGAGYSSDYGWEWSMVYEWSVELGPGGTNCGNELVYLVTGLSHHSPSKNDQENDVFPPPDDPEDPIFTDWGDLPDGYGTTDTADGARHYLTADSPYLGQALATELDGQPTADASGDGAEEDGITFDINEAWIPDATVSFTATVSGNNGYLVAWFDWDNDGSLSEAEKVTFGGLADGVHTLALTVPGDASTEGYFYMRFRLFNSQSLPATILPTGAATGGEVEDYRHEWVPTAVDLASFTATPQGNAIELSWETVSEVDNVGFYLYRAESPTGSRIQLNEVLIRSLLPPGSPEGAVYTFVDQAVVPGTTYYYWLEDVDVYGVGTLHGPVSAGLPSFPCRLPTRPRPRAWLVLPRR
jgi:hypothetical protein